MKKILFAGFLMLLLNNCSDGQNTAGNKTDLEAKEFANKLEELPLSPIIDVRTPGEFSQGHLTNALNYDWNSNDFEKQIESLDKATPVFVYCLSGGRSAAAAAKMRSEGFAQVYELSGGLMKWRAANLPETIENAIFSDGMDKQQFDELLAGDKLVFVDFYADWCAPCKKMKPYLDEISSQMADKVLVQRVNVDANRAICKTLHIDELPVLQLYKNKQLIWSHKGYIDKEEVMTHLNQ